MGVEPRTSASVASLEWLVAPFASQQFLREHWEQKPLLLKRGQRTYFDGLLTLDDIDRVLTSLNLAHPEVSLTDARRDINPDAYTLQNRTIDAARLYQHYRDGSTIIIQQLHQRVASLGLLCRALERELSTRFQTNIYVTPRDAQGFKPHYDTHDVFVMQIHGSKDWSLYNTPVELPFRNQEFRRDVHAVGSVSEQFVLEAGDVLYLPRGIIHDARATQEMSVHITLGVLFTSWAELLTEALARVALSDRDFRRSLPVGFANPGYERTAARATFRELLARVAQAAELDGAMNHFVDELISSRNPMVPGQFWQLERLAKLETNDTIRRRTNVLYRLEDTSDAVILHVYGDAIRFPVHAREALMAALTCDEFTVGSLPGTLDDDGKLVLVRRLVSEGFLEVAL